MKEKNIYKHWVVPVLGCNDQMGENKNSYANRPVGNLPELMCLDMSLNKDVWESLQMHVTMTQKLDKNDPRRFSNAPPNKVVKSIRWLLNPDEIDIVPTSTHIFQDIDRVDFSLKEIMKAKGTVVPGLCERIGHQKRVHSGDRRGHHIRRKKSYQLHVDALDIADETKENIKAMYEVNLSWI